MFKGNDKERIGTYNCYYCEKSITMSEVKSQEKGDKIILCEECDKIKRKRKIKLIRRK